MDELVDSNLQRENILPSEKAFAYQMKLEAMKRQGARNDLTSAQIGQKSEKGYLKTFLQIKSAKVAIKSRDISASQISLRRCSTWLTKRRSR